jgi:hypothetical protein
VAGITTDVDAMRRTNLTQFDEMPEAMVAYMRHYGPHFNRKLFEFAVSLMTKESNGKGVPVTPYNKEQVKNILASHGVQLKNDQLYDSAYVANMCKADFLGSSITDERHLAMYVKDVIDDPDGYDGIVFNRWYADMCYTGVAIDWEEMI